MKLTLFKPNPKKTGSLFSFNVGRNDKGYSLYINAVKQASWDSNKKTGSFKENVKDPDKTITLKFNSIEAGGFIAAMRNNIPFSTYHSGFGGSDGTWINFDPFPKNYSHNDNDYVEPCWSLKVKQGDLKFVIGITSGEAVVLEEVLRDLIQKQATFNGDTANAQNTRDKSNDVEDLDTEDDDYETEEEEDDVPF